MKSIFSKFMLAALLLGAVLLFSCKNKTYTMETRNEATVRSILAAMDAGAVQEFDKYLATGFMISNPFLPKPGDLGTFKGLMQGQKAAFPDVHHEIVQLFSKGNMVCVRGIFKGTNTGSMQGNPPTGNRVEIPFIFTDEFDESGKVISRDVQFDTGAFNAQLAAMNQ